MGGLKKLSLLGGSSDLSLRAGFIYKLNPDSGIYNTECASLTVNYANTITSSFKEIQFLPIGETMTKLTNITFSNYTVVEYMIPLKSLNLINTVFCASSTIKTITVPSLINQIFTLQLQMSQIHTLSLYLESQIALVKILTLITQLNWQMGMNFQVL
jgi:hypothetical protein